MVKKNKIKFYHQFTSNDCGAASLCMVLSYWGYRFTLDQVKNLFEFTRNGVKIQDILFAARSLKFKATAVKLSVSEIEEIPFPIILFWKQDHFLVFEKITKAKKHKYVYLYDPGFGRTKLDYNTFVKNWCGEDIKGVGIIITKDSNITINDIKLPKKNRHTKQTYKDVRAFIKKKKYKYTVSVLFLIISLIMTWCIPFLFQKIIDEGISLNNMDKVNIILIFQFSAFIIYFFSDFISKLILVKFNFILSLFLREGLLLKLMKLPINYFDTRLNTETLERFGDQNTIQSYITNHGVNFLISILNILIFGTILVIYSKQVFVIYSVLTILSIFWVYLFLNKRKVIEYSMFLQKSENNNMLFEFIMNMPEIKINDAQNKIVNKILKIQKTLNSLYLKSLFLNLYQLIGTSFISKFKEILTIGICSYFIIYGDMSLGVLLSITYVVGQLSGPVDNIIEFIKITQDVKIASQRIGDIHNTKEEDIAKQNDLKNTFIKSIMIEDVSFKYLGTGSPYVLKNISFSIKPYTVTAIVGASGSGKTTILKLLLSYYQVKTGKILLNNANLNNISAQEWRKRCGIVLQDGKIFSGSIIDNIAIADEKPDFNRIKMACKMASIDKFISSLPLGYNTKIGNIGIQLSGGQSQRILIARAVYKNPEFLFLDEATSALDAENELIIHNNLQRFFKERTVMIIAHRLSTVKNADQIIVMKEGEVVEIGKHNNLINSKSHYYNLVKNQLELGN